MSSLLDLSNYALINTLLEASNQNMIGCLVNCSLNGVCRLNTLASIYMCYCDQYFAGVKCDIDLRPCALNPCLNEGQCNNINETKGYTCNCTQYYIGVRCENKIDACQNVTCSSSGYCKDVNNKPECECFLYYSGESCEIKSSKLTVIKITQQVAVIIVICSFATVALTILFLDIDCCRQVRNTKMQRINKITKGPMYVNFKTIQE